MRKLALEHTLILVTLMGLLFYGGALLVYSRFYGSFGLSPDEVGLSYTAALTHVVPAFLLWLWAWTGIFISLLILLFFASAVMSVAKRVIGWKRERGSSRRAPDDSERDDLETPSSGTPPKSQASGDANTQEREADSLLRRMFLAYKVEALVGLAALLIVLFLVSALEKPATLAERVHRTGEVQPISDTNRISWWWDAIWRNPLRIRVELVRVWPASSGTALPAKLSAGSTLAYLGRTADTIVLYDRAHRRTLRIPATQVVLSDSVG